MDMSEFLLFTEKMEHYRAVTNFCCIISLSGLWITGLLKENRAAMCGADSCGDPCNDCVDQDIETVKTITDWNMGLCDFFCLFTKVAVIWWILPAQKNMCNPSIWHIPKDCSTLIDVIICMFLLSIVDGSMVSKPDNFSVLKQYSEVSSITEADIS